MKRTVSGILMLAFALLGMYCSLRAFQVHRELNGRPDIHDSARNWSIGATACFVACGVVAVTLGKKNATGPASAGDADADTGERQTRGWWRTPVGVTLVAAAVIAVVIVVILTLQPPPRPPSPVVAPSAPEAPRAPGRGPSTVP